MIDLLRRSALVLFTVGFLFQAVGAGRVWARGTEIDCCCGRHLAGRECGCVHCPTRAKKRQAHDYDCVSAPLGCTGGSDGIALLVTALLPAVPELVPMQSPPRLLVLSPPRQLLSNTLEPSRPPP